MAQIKVLLDISSPVNRGNRLLEAFKRYGINPLTFNRRLAVSQTAQFDIVVSYDLKYVFNGKVVLNQRESLVLCKDKFYCNKLAEKLGIRTPKTYLDYNSELGYPFILKDRYGSLGNNCYLIHNAVELKSILAKTPKVEYIYQEFISASKGQHYRLMWLGDKVIAAMHVVNDNDFKSNFHQGGKIAAYEPTAQDNELCRQLADMLNINYCGFDFLIDEKGNKVFCEANGGAFFKGLESATGIDIGGKVVEYVLAEYEKLNKK